MFWIKGKEKKMKVTKNLGFLLLGIWLIITGLSQVMSIPVESLGMILAILGIASGAMIILGR